MDKTGECLTRKTGFRRVPQDAAGECDRVLAAVVLWAHPGLSYGAGWNSHHGGDRYGDSHHGETQRRLS